MLSTSSRLLVYTTRHSYIRHSTPDPLPLVKYAHFAPVPNWPYACPRRSCFNMPGFADRLVGWGLVENTLQMVWHLSWVWCFAIRSTLVCNTAVLVCPNK